MASEIETPRITELQVRMDCNGCVQKIKKALHGIRGIYEVYPDIAQQKLKVIGWADPDKIIEAIRKTRKTVTICSHMESPEAAAQPLELPGSGQVVPETSNTTPSEAPPPAEAAAPQPEAAVPTAEPPKDQPPPENRQPELAPTAADANLFYASQPQPREPSGPKDVGEVRVICNHPPDYRHRYGYVHSYEGGGPCSRQYPTCHTQHSFYPNGQPFHQEPPPHPQPQQPIVTHSYNKYKPSPYATEYVCSPSQYSHDNRIDHYNNDYYSNYSYGHSYNNSNGNVASMFSDENRNACRIM